MRDNRVPGGSHEAGGIYNVSFSLQAELTVSDSSITGNTAGGNGGGISNFQGIARITGSTLSANTGAGLGGGIVNYRGNFTGTLTVTNSTISDNHGSSGGGIYNSGGAVHLRNVTIARNGATPNIGGGLANPDTGDVTLRNTLIADNTAGSFGPDCFATVTREAALVSEGTNLIEDVTNCDVSGDTTGNISGQDPVLGPLTDNGGPTPTHALLAGSPAIDHGNAAPPGSGGFSCATIDQRGVVRPQGAGCDIGAYETAAPSGPPFFIVPNRAGDGGPALVSVYGPAVESGATIALVRPGESILGAPVAVVGSVLSTTFDLTGRATGAWDVVVTGPGGAPATLPGGFTIESARAPDLWVDVIGRTGRIRVDRPERYTILFGNRGNVDATGATLLLTVPSDVPIDLLSPVTPPPPHPAQVPTDWSGIPITPTIGGLNYLPLFLPVVPAGFVGMLEFTVTPPSTRLGIRFDIRAEIAVVPLDAQVAPLVDGARAYAQDVLGVDLAPDLTPALETYLTMQLEDAVAHGLGTAVTTGNTRPEVLSLPQLVVDLARFGAAQPPGGSGLLGRITRLAAWLVQPGAVRAQSVGSCGERGLVYDAQRGRCTNNGCQPGSGSKCGGGGPSPEPATSGDPNEKLGSLGVEGSHALVEGEPLRYAVLFENMATALLPAQEVVIRDQLDGAVVDLDSFSLGPIGFGSRTVTPPPGLSQFSTTVDLRPAQPLLVALDAALDKSSGLVTWRFTSVDPETLELTTDPEAGFLPPNVDPPAGEGRVLFTVQPRIAGTPICNRARIVFDTNDPIDTPEWCNAVETTSTTTTSSTTTSSTTSSSTSTSSSTTSCTATTSITTSSSIPPPTSTSTTVPTPSSTTTTLPPTPTAPADPCATVARGPSFVSITCRLDALLARMRQDGALATAGTLADSLEKARTLSMDAARFCAVPNAKKHRQRLAQALHAVQRYTHRLSARALRRSLDPTLREALLAEGKAIGAISRSCAPGRAAPRTRRSADGARSGPGFRLYRPAPSPIQSLHASLLQPRARGAPPGAARRTTRSS